MKQNRWSLLLAMGVVLSVGGRMGYLQWQQPKHTAEIGRAYGYANWIYGVPQVNPDGRQLTYFQMSDNGIGLYLLDVASGQKQLVHDKLPTDDFWETLDIWPWSPDGTYFIFTHTNLFVCAGATGKIESGLPVDGQNGVAALVWLNLKTFFYVSKAGNPHRIEQGENGHWHEVPSLKAKVGAEGLTALSEDTVCWQKGNRIWSLNLNSGEMAVLFDAQADRLEGFSYSTKSKEFLINRSNKNGSTLWRMIFHGTELENYGQVGAVAAAQNVAWLDGKKNICAFTSTQPGHPENRWAEILPKPMAEPVRLFASGTVDALAVSGDGKALFIVGTVSNEPVSGVWQYEMDSGALRCLVAYSDYPSLHAQRMNVRRETVSFSPGNQTYYYVYEPAGLDPNARKKYPLILGDSFYRTLDPSSRNPENQNRFAGTSWSPMLANGGAYVVIVDRPTWFQELDHWEEYVDWVYQKMLSNPTIDPAQVYLWGASAETEHLSNLAQKYPDRWKGLILINPAMLPDLPTLAASPSPPKIFYSQGALEGTNSAVQYQLEAAKNGIQVEFYAHEREAHWVFGKRALGERAEKMMQFIFQN